MKTKFTMLILAVVIIVLGVMLLHLTHRTCKNDKSASAIENILTRKSVRNYTGEAIPSSVQETIMRCAMAAPTAMNIQPWTFIVVDTQEARNKLMTLNFQPEKIATAGMVVIVCADQTKFIDGSARDFWIEDCSAATQNILLAAHAEGLGAVWCGIYPVPEKIEMFSELYQLPDNIIPFAMVTIGHPAENPAVKDKWSPEKIHRNYW
ncbi:MAG: nitroreductase family protein [Alistipes sp.]|nr:nitroreductase family protein [Candidatus Alistipes equi]